MAVYKFNGARAVALTTRTGKEFTIPLGTVFDALTTRSGYTTLNVLGKKYIVDNTVFNKRVMPKSAASKAKLTAPVVTKAVVKAPAKKAAPATPVKAERLKISLKGKQGATVKNDKQPAPKTTPAPKVATTKGVDLTDVVWFKYSAPRGKSLKDSRGNAYSIKTGTIFGIKAGRSKDSIVLPEFPKAKLMLSTADSDKLRTGAKPYKGKVVMPNSHQITIDVHGDKKQVAVPKSNAPTSPKPAKEKQVDAATLKSLAQEYAFGAKAFTGNMAKVIMKAAYDKGYTESMRKWLLRQTTVKNAADAAIAIVEKWKPEGRFLPEGNAGKTIKIDMNVPARPKLTGTGKPPRTVNSPAVEFRPQPTGKPLTIQMDDKEDNWGDEIPELEYDDEVPDSVLDMLESDSSNSNNNNSDEELILEFAV